MKSVGLSYSALQRQFLSYSKGRLYYPLFSLTVDMVIESFDSSNLLAANFFMIKKTIRKIHLFNYEAEL